MREDETSLFFCILLDLSSNLGGKIGSFNGKTEKTFNYPPSAKYLVLENTGTGTYATFGMLLIDLSNKKFVGCTVSSNGTSYPSYGTKNKFRLKNYIHLHKIVV